MLFYAGVLFVCSAGLVLSGLNVFNVVMDYSLGEQFRAGAFMGGVLAGGVSLAFILLTLSSMAKMLRNN